MKKIVMLMVVSALGFSGALLAGDDNDEVCNAVMEAIGGHENLTAQLNASVFVGGEDPDDDDPLNDYLSSNGGFDLEMWATVVGPDGTVCAVTKTGEGLNDQWLGSRVISAQKANTAIAFGLPGLALSTANLWAPTQPGGSLFGLQFSNPVDTKTAYKGNAGNFGQHNDPMVNHRIGGVNVFGGGLALYTLGDGDEPKLIGAIGVSGDSSCADHNIAWRVRDALGLDYVPSGVNSDGSDNIIFDLGLDGVSTGGFGHPVCTGAGNVGVNAGIVGDHPIEIAP
jgi:uncharacterized protein GlcG (DUF336 family)